MNTFHALVIVALTVVSCAAHAQQPTHDVRVITPDSEHIYSSDVRLRGVILDGADLREQNERAAEARRQQQLEQERIDIIRRQEAAESEYARAKAEAEQAAANAWDAREKARRRANGGTGF